MPSLELQKNISSDSFRAGPGAAAGWFGIYYGWCTVAITVLATMLIVGSTNYAFALFVKPVSAELGLSRASINSGMIFFHVGTAIFSPLVGRALDRYSARSIALISAALFGSGMVIIGTTSSLPLMAFCIVFLIAVGSLGCGGLFGAVVVSRWFQQLRGRALAISAMGTSFGGLVVFPIIAVLIDRFGWRLSLIATGLGIWLSVSLLALALRQPPIVAKNATEKLAQDIHWPLRAILRSGQFWIIAVAISLMLGVDGAVLVTVTPYAQERGFSLSEVTSLMMATTLSAIAGKIFIAWVADKIDLRILIVITAFLGVVQCGVFLLTPSYELLLAINFIAGAAIGGTYPLYSAIVAERFGVESYGWVRGLMTPVNSLFTSAILYAIGALYDRDGHYMNGYLTLLICAALAIILILTLKKRDHYRGPDLMVSAQAA